MTADDRSWLLLSGALALVTALSGCFPDPPNDWPVEITVPEGLQQCQYEAIYGGMGYWNNHPAFGVQLFMPVQEGGHSFISTDEPRKHVADYDYYSGEIRIGTDCEDYIVIAHELGHVLGIDHDNEPVSLMSVRPDAVRELRPWHIRHVRNLMDLEAP